MLYDMGIVHVQYTARPALMRRSYWASFPTSQILLAALVHNPAGTRDCIGFKHEISLVLKSTKVVQSL